MNSIHVENTEHTSTSVAAVGRHRIAVRVAILAAMFLIGLTVARPPDSSQQVDESQPDSCHVMTSTNTRCTDNARTASALLDGERLGRAVEAELAELNGRSMVDGDGFHRMVQAAVTTLCEASSAGYCS